MSERERERERGHCLLLWFDNSTTERKYDFEDSTLNTNAYILTRKKMS
jgi:hypothetical protein